MKLQQHLLNHYLRIPFEDFSHRAVSAKRILVSIKHSPFANGSTEKIDDAITKIEKIIKATDSKTDVSLFVLDRNIMPQDKAKGVEYITTFTKNLKTDGESDKVKLGQDEIQKRLCNATMEIDDILMQELAGYSDQMNMDGQL